MQIFAYANNKSIVVYIDAVWAPCNKFADIAVVAITSKPSTNYIQTFQISRNEIKNHLQLLLSMWTFFFRVVD